MVRSGTPRKVDDGRKPGDEVTGTGFDCRTIREFRIVGKGGAGRGGKALEDESLVVGAEEHGGGNDAADLEEQRRGQLTDVSDAAGVPPVGPPDIVEFVYLGTVDDAGFGEAGGALGD